MQSNHNTFAYLAAISAVFFWGFSFVWSNVLLINNIPVFTFLFIRLAIAGILLTIFSKCIKKLQKVETKDMLWMGLMAFCEPFVYFLGETFGMKATGSAVITSVVIATIPIFCLIMEKIIWHVPFNVYKVTGILLTLPGIGLVVFQEGALNVEHVYGIALLFMAVISSIAYSTTVKKLSAKYNAITITTYQFVIGPVFFLPFFLLYGLDGLTPNFFSFKILSTIITLAVFCSCVSFVFWVHAIGKLGITRTNIFSALIPAVSAVGAFMLGQEELTIIKVAGVAIVIIGVIMAQKESKRLN